MKKTLFLFAATALLTACGGSEETPTDQPVTPPDTATTAETTEPETTEPEVKMIGEYMSFGDEITTDGVVALDEVIAQLESTDTVMAKIEIPIIEVCQKKGCWMTVDLGNEEDMMVRFKDYGFFVPADAGGKTTIAEGKLFNTVTSVDDLKHYAGDAGKSQEEIDAITEPETTIAFEASGVLIK